MEAVMRLLRLLIVSFCSLLLLSGPVYADSLTATTSPSVSPEPVDNGYLIGSGDLLKVEVFPDRAFKRLLRVDGEGTIHLPLAGDIRVIGKTPNEVARFIREILANGYYRNPQVLVAVEEYRSQRISVLGAVRKPMVITLRGPSDVLSALGEAGGLSEKAGGRIVLVRQISGAGTSVTVLDGRALLERGDLSQNRPVFPGDTLFAQKAHEIYLFGEVNRPGSYPYQEGLTLLRAISVAGGLKVTAREGRIEIIRKAGGGGQRQYVDFDRVIDRKSPDPLLKPDDVIMVPESFF